ncbi:MAG: hypothetical protein OJF59_000316 [Cytophagales bacterium]|nr:MAG: hypothetical protein OJF59_000316 [Cytophagales bacterium]
MKPKHYYFFGWLSLVSYTQNSADTTSYPSIKKTLPNKRCR